MRSQARLLLPIATALSLACTTITPVDPPAEVELSAALFDAVEVVGLEFRFPKQIWVEAATNPDGR